MVCAAALQKAVERLDGVEKTTISLNRGLATVVLKPQNQFSLETLKRKVKDSGFTAGAMEITAAGEITRWKNQPAFQVSGRSDLVFLLAPAARDHARALEVAGTKALVTGTVPESPKRTAGQPATLRVTKVETLPS